MSFVVNEIKILSSIKAVVLAHKHNEDQETIRDYLNSTEEGKGLIEKTWRSFTFEGNMLRCKK